MKKEITNKDLRQFGIVLGLILIALGGLHFRKGNDAIFPWLLTIGLLSVVTGTFLPGILRPTYKVFTKVTHAIGWFNTRVILIVVYYFILTPIGLLMRLFGKDPMDRKIKKYADSYWTKHSKVTATKTDLLKQF